MFRTASLISSIECRHYLQSQVRVTELTEALPLRSIDCLVLAYTALNIDGISRNRQVTYSEVKEMWEMFFVCKPVCQWLDIRVSFSDGLLVGCSFLKSISAMSAWYVGRETESVFWSAGHRTNGKVLLFTAVTRNHGNGQKSRYTRK